ncbi:hypothetical protein [uncultured Sphingomonas sp.]|uniref:hypothetical protein n=1 Tax=uncultured Sphingomonas sp. TaxID=158754 RepID=UPI0025CE84B8|nr:hypothetical protein [uncultured Sphingomonas sp.]
MKSGWDSQFKQELRNAFARNGIIPPADYLVAELFSDTLVTRNTRQTVSPAFESLPRSRVMNEWQKAGSGLAASNDGCWVRAVGRATDPA